MTDSEIMCPLIKGNCYGVNCCFYDKLQADEELTLDEQKGNCMLVRAVFEISISR